MKETWSTEQLTTALLEWYHQNRRTLPWRESRDPYHVWLSELMLQQTQVQTVLPYFQRFLERFPTLEDLAQASLNEVYQLWEGLGYYRRALHLHQGAQLVVQEHQGRLPQTRQDLLKLPGVGPYTAGAIASIAFDQPETAIDGNVQRVISRLLALDQPVDEKGGQTAVQKTVQGLLEHAPHPGDFTQALMELGALVCLPRQSQCASCPWNKSCLAFQRQEVETFPKKAPPRAKKCEKVAALLLGREGYLLLSQRPGKGLWGHLWVFPMSQPVPLESPLALKALSDRFPQSFDPGNPPKASLLHHFTHRTWTIDLYEDLQHSLPLFDPPPGSQWVSLSHLEDWPMPVPLRRYLKSMGSRAEESPAVPDNNTP